MQALLIIPFNGCQPRLQLLKHSCQVASSPSLLRLSFLQDLMKNTNVMHACTTRQASVDIWLQGACELTVAGHQGQVRDLPHTTCPAWNPDSCVRAAAGAAAGAVAGAAAAVAAWVAAWSWVAAGFEGGAATWG